MFFRENNWSSYSQSVKHHAKVIYFLTISITNINMLKPEGGEGSRLTLLQVLHEKQTMWKVSIGRKWYRKKFVRFRTIMFSIEFHNKTVDPHGSFFATNVNIYIITKHKRIQSVRCWKELSNRKALLIRGLSPTRFYWEPCAQIWHE